MKASYAIVLGLVTVASIGTGWLFQEAGGVPETRPAKSWGYTNSEIVANGIVEGATPEVTLRPEIQTRVVAIYARENTEVKQGQLLVQLESHHQQYNLALAKAKLSKAKANMARVLSGERKEKREALAAIEAAKQTLYLHAKTEYARAQQLRGSGGGISESEWDKAHFKYLTAEAEWKQAKAELELIQAPPRPEDLKMAEAEVSAAEVDVLLAQVELAKTRILAPSDGRVLQTYVETGEMVGPDSPKSILIMTNLGKRRVRAFVEEWDCGRVQMGQKAVITTDSYPGIEYRGKVVTVLSRMGKRAPQTNAPGEYNDVYFREVIVELEQGEELPLNLRVHARIFLEPNESNQGGPGQNHVIDQQNP